MRIEPIDGAKDSWKLPPQQCPWCEARLDAATNPFGSERPAKGHVSLCIRCGQIVEFDKKLRLIKPDFVKLEQAKREDKVFGKHIADMQAAWRKLRAT